LILLGKIVKVRGIKGEVVITPSPHIDRCTPKKGDILHLKSSKYQRHFTVDYYKEISGHSVIKFEHSQSIDDALKLVGYSVYHPSAEPQNEETVLEFAVKDLQGNPWGTVKDLQSAGLSQLLEVEDTDGEIIYVPYSDGIVKSVDPVKKLIIIDPPEGLKELNK
jgi:16S rRNA processing protein RimM